MNFCSSFKTLNSFIDNETETQWLSFVKEFNLEHLWFSVGWSWTCTVYHLLIRSHFVLYSFECLSFFGVLRFFIKISQLRSLSIWLCLYYTSLCIPNLVIKDKFIFIYCIKLFPVYTTFWFLFSLHAEIYWFFGFFYQLFCCTWDMYFIILL